MLVCFHLALSSGDILVRNEDAVTYEELSKRQEFWKAVKNLDVVTLTGIFAQENCPGTFKSYSGLSNAIFYAITHNNVDMLRLFLSQFETLPMNIKPDPIEIAVMANNLEMVKLLNAKNVFWMKGYDYLNSPIFVAHLIGNKEIEDYLWKCLEQEGKRRLDKYKAAAEFYNC